MQVRKDPKTIQKACESIPYSRALYEKWKTEDYPTDDFDWAVQWFYKYRSGISKGNVENVPQTGWCHSRKSGQNPEGGYISACTAFQSFSNRVKGAARISASSLKNTIAPILSFMLILRMSANNNFMLEGLKIRITGSGTASELGERKSSSLLF